MEYAWTQSTIFTDRTSPDGIFEPCEKCLECDNPEVPILNWKAAEDDGGYIVRLWNISDKPQTAAVAFTGCTVTAANLTNMVECDLPDSEITVKQNACIVTIKEKEIVNIRVYLNKI